ncbi:unnamed protein product [Enterobius vermicularis]|uniref:TPR_REGION domain-containing protein n=1 Tax=Enterobius vermicularis TaxID=51028 RepID=A0A0N4VHI2_ENTVE|nr:unnamed protein product [Enterobius vermicularis]
MVFSSADIQERLCGVRKRKRTAQFVSKEQEGKEGVLKRRARDAETVESEVDAARCLAFSYRRSKDLTARAFLEDLIDRLPRVVEKETLHSAALLDASVRIYSSRVDLTLSQVFEIKASLGKEESGSIPDDDSSELSTLESITKPSDVKTKSVRPVQNNTNISEEIDQPNENQDPDSAANINFGFHFSFIELIRKFQENGVKQELFLQVYLKNKEEALTGNTVRREKLSSISDRSDNIDGQCDSTSVIPLYERAARNYGDGSSCGMLLLNAITDDSILLVVIHNYAEVVVNDVVKEVDLVEMLILYECVLEMEKYYDVPQQDELDENLCLVEHEFCIATQQISRYKERNIGFLTNFSAMTSESLALVKIALRGVDGPTKLWFCERLFVVADTSLPFLKPSFISGDNGLCRAKVPIMAAKYAFFYAEDSCHTEKCKTEGLPPYASSISFARSIKRFVVTKNDLALLWSIISNYESRRLLKAACDQWKREAVEHDMKLEDIDAEDFVQDSSLFVSGKCRVSTEKVDEEGCYSKPLFNAGAKQEIFKNTADESHWHFRLSKGSGAVNLKNTGQKKLLFLFNLLLAGFFSAVAPFNNKSDDILNSGTERFENNNEEVLSAEYEEEVITGPEGIFAEAFGLTHLAKNRYIDTPLIRGVILAALTNLQWLDDLPRSNSMTSIVPKRARLRKKLSLSYLLVQVCFGDTRKSTNFAVTDVFLVLLQLCNEKDLELLQTRDERGMILSKNLDDFIILV